MASKPFYSDGAYYAISARGLPAQRLAVGYYFLNDDGVIERYSGDPGLQGFWSAIGDGFESVGHWVGNNFATIATLGAGVYAIHSGLQLGGPSQGVAQQTAQQAAAANAAAAAAAQQNSLGNLTQYLPYLLIGLVAVFALTRGAGQR